MVVNAFTVDLEEWFQGLTSTNPQVERWDQFESRVEMATQTLLGLLRQGRVSATFFALGHLADHHPQLIETILSDGHELAIHGYYHRFVHRLTPDEFRRELEMTIRAVEKISGKAPLGHRAPYFSINAGTPWAFQCLAEAGLSYDSSVFPMKSLLYGFPGAPRFPYRLAGNPGVELVEFPISTLKLGSFTLPFAGGFYLRSLPYFFIRWAVRQLNAAGNPAILYMHPWELDTGQRYDRVTPRERLTHYHGRRSLAGKLQALFADFQFTSLGTLVQHADLRTDRFTI